MSSVLHPSILVVNSFYHVGHVVPFYIAHEQGFFREEGLVHYEHGTWSLLPHALERDGLALAIRDHGADVVTSVDIASALAQRLKGEDLYIISGWRYTPDLKWYGRHGITHVSQLRGKRIGLREKDGIISIFMENALRDAGIDPDTEVEWVYSAVFGYGNDPAHLQMLRSGQIDAMYSSPFIQQREKEPFPLLLDPAAIFPRRMGKVVVAPGKSIRERPDEIRAYLRGQIRAFWFMRDVSHFQYLRDLEERLRSQTHNEEERYIRMVTSPEKVESWSCPIDGAVSAAELKTVMDDLVARGQLARPLPVDEVMEGSLVKQAYEELSRRLELQSALAVTKRAVEKYGF
jgi:ABC-type nitrate/sulfonate/bicarbonate transport system substrate-binding protein